MKKILKYVLMVLLFSLAILLFNQTSVKAATNYKYIKTIEELKDVFEEKATIDGNLIKLIEDVSITKDELVIEIPELIIDFNGKKIDSGELISIQGKVTLKDTVGGGGMHFQKMFGGFIVKKNAELIIDDGKFEDSGVSYMFTILGKLVINDGDFISTDNNPDKVFRAMLSLSNESETIINGGNFVDTDKIIKTGSKNYKLTINGGNFKGINGPIEIDVAYSENDLSILPKVIFNDCNIEGGGSGAIFIMCGTSDEKLTNLNEKAVIFNGGTYKCTGRWVCC